MVQNGKQELNEDTMEKLLDNIYILKRKIIIKSKIKKKKMIILIFKQKIISIY